MDDAPHCWRHELDAGYTTEIRDEGTGPVVVFVHPTPLDRRMWNGVFGRLADRRTIAYDLRGHGSARDVPFPSFYGPFTDDLAHLLDACGAERAHVVGLGFGGEIAQAFALRHPRRLRTLTILGARADPLPILSITANNVLHDRDAAHAAALARWFTPEELEADGEAVQYTLACLRATAPATFASALQTYAAFDIRDRLPRIDAPTRVIATDRDIIVRPEHAMELAKLLPKGELRVVPGAGPLLPLEDPERFVTLLDHVARVRQPQPA